MDSYEADLLVLGGNGFLGILRIGKVMERDVAAEAEGQVILTDLVILRHIRIEVVLAVEFADLRNFAAEHEPCQCRQVQCLFVHDGERTGKAQANRAHVGIGLRTMFDGAGGTFSSAF